MKQKPTFKSLLQVAAIFSFFAFVFVNVHSGLGAKRDSSLLKKEFVQAELEDNQDSDGKISIPDVAILGSLWEIAQKFLDRKN